MRLSKICRNEKYGWIRVLEWASKFSLLWDSQKFEKFGGSF